MNPVVESYLKDPDSHLLGKALQWDNKTPSRGFILQDHIAQCVDQHVFLCDEPVLGENSFVERLALLMDLDSVQTERIKKISRLATILHDLGKANSEFQGMLKAVVQSQDQKAKGQYPTETRHQQTIRHERVSWWWLRTRLWDWLVKQLDGSELDAWICCSAVVGHHLKTDKAAITGVPVSLYGVAVSKTVNPLLLKHKFDKIDLQDESLIPEGAKGIDGDLTGVSDEDADWYNPSREDTKVLLVCRWLVILADTLGSIDYPAGGRKGWSKHLKQTLRDLWAPRQINYRTDHYIKDYAKVSRTLKGFQRKASQVHGNLLLTASCGGGKTTAAFLWAESNVPLVFSTPTTGTATQLYLEYGRGAADTGNRHGRAAVDELMVNSTYDELKPDPVAMREDLDIVRDLQCLQDNVTYCTIDQVVGLMGNYRKSILWLLHLVRCQLVVDEAHALDSKLQTAFNQFRETFPNLRVAVMSASLAPKVRELYTVSSRVQPFQWVPASGRETTEPRYRFEIIQEQEADKHFKPGCLWIVNRVAKAQGIAQQDLSVNILHSRYKYEDRRARQNQFIQDFKVNPGTAKGVATQVAEMSFDISAASMIMQGCPAESIVQRLGRLNRYLELQPGVGVCYIYRTNPEDTLPYTKQSLDLGWKLVEALAGRDFSQKELEEELQEVLRNQTVWSSGYVETHLNECVNKSVREETNPTIQVLLDVDACALGQFPKSVDLQRLEIPIPLKKSLQVQQAGWAQIKYRWVLPKTAQYCPRLGLLMDSLEDS